MPWSMSLIGVPGHVIIAFFILWVEVSFAMLGFRVFWCAKGCGTDFRSAGYLGESESCREQVRYLLARPWQRRLARTTVCSGESSIRICVLARSHVHHPSREHSLCWSPRPVLGLPGTGSISSSEAAGTEISVRNRLASADHLLDYLFWFARLFTRRLANIRSAGHVDLSQVF